MEAINIASYFVKKSDPLTNQTITPIKLQYLLYYSLGWHYCFVGTTLFEDQIEAWAYGPVIRNVQRHFHPTNGYRRLSPDESQNMRYNTINEETKSVLDAVWSYYCDYDTNDLGEMAMMERPWRNAREGLHPLQSSDRLITHDCVRDFFTDLVSISSKR